MLTKAASMALVVTAGSGLTAAAGYSAYQLVADSGTASAASKPADPPGQTKKPSPSPAAEPPPKNLTLSVDDLTVSGLVPGASGPATVTVNNPNNQDVILQSFAVALGAMTPSPPAGYPCSPATDFTVTFGLTSAVEIKKHSARSVPVTVRMNETGVNQDGCKSKSFTFTLTATATSK